MSKRSPQRDQAKEIWLQSECTITNRELAARLAVDEKLIACWKVRDCWTKDCTAVLQDKRSTAKTNRKLASAIEEAVGLTEKEKVFCLWYVRTNNGSSAVRKAGYDTIYIAQMAYDILQRSHVKAEIKRLRAIRNNDMLASVDDLVELHFRIAFADMTDFVTWGPREVKQTITDPQTGEETEKSVEINDLIFIDSKRVDGQLVSEVKLNVEGGASIKLVDRQKSMDFLDRYFTANPMDKHRKAYDDAKLALQTRSVKVQEDKLHGLTADVDKIKDDLRSLLEIVNSPAPNRSLSDDE